MKIKIIFISLFCLYFFCSPIYVLAQVIIDPDPTINPCPDPKLNDCPIDSNVYLLVVAAIFFAARKAYFIKNETAKKKLV